MFWKSLERKDQHVVFTLQLVLDISERYGSRRHMCGTQIYESFGIGLAGLAWRGHGNVNSMQLLASRTSRTWNSVCNRLRCRRHEWSLSLGSLCWRCPSLTFRHYRLQTHPVHVGLITVSAPSHLAVSLSSPRLFTTFCTRYLVRTT